jgi:aminoglycoside phosphotransferase (APT) family kinase protein
MHVGGPPSRLVLEEVARSVVEGKLDVPAEASSWKLLQLGQQHAVLLLQVERPTRRLALKVASTEGRASVDLARTAAVLALARQAGAPVSEVLAVGTLDLEVRWQYLLQQHVAGVPWRWLRPRLDSTQLGKAHRQIAAAVLAVQSVQMPSFGELDSRGLPAGTDLLSAVRQRAGLRILDRHRRVLFAEALDQRAELFADPGRPTLSHDDLHHENVLFHPASAGVRLVALLDWDKAWAGPAESDVARMALWDDMTGPDFWATYRAAVPYAEGADERAMLYQLLWCLEYDAPTARHRSDTLKLCQRLGLRTE